MIDTYPIKPSFTLIYLFLLLLLFFTLTLTHPFSFSLVLLSRLLKFSLMWNSWLNFLVFYLFFSQLSFLTQFVSSLISLPSTQFVSLKKILCSPICSYGFFFFFLDVLMLVVFLWDGFFLDVLMLNVSCEMGFFFGSTDAGCFLMIVILVFILFYIFIYFYVGCFQWEDCDFIFFFSVRCLVLFSCERQRSFQIFLYETLEC